MWSGSARAASVSGRSTSTCKCRFSNAAVWRSTAATTAARRSISRRSPLVVGGTSPSASASREQPRSLAHLGERRRDAASDDDRERDAHRRGDDEGSYEEHHDAVAEHRLSARDGFAVLDHDLRERPAAEDERADREHAADEQRDRSHGDRDLSAEAEALHLSMTAR